MGYYSYIKDEDYSIVDLEGLRQWKELMVAQNVNSELKGIWKDVNLSERGIHIFDMIKEGWKIIGYWYTDFLVFLRDMAMFVEGFLLLEGEDGEQFARIEFKDGDVKITVASLKWDKERSVEELGCPALTKSEKTLRQL